MPVDEGVGFIAVVCEAWRITCQGVRLWEGLVWAVLDSDWEGKSAMG